MSQYRTIHILVLIRYFRESKYSTCEYYVPSVTTSPSNYSLQQCCPSPRTPNSQISGCSSFPHPLPPATSCHQYPSMPTASNIHRHLAKPSHPHIIEFQDCGLNPVLTRPLTWSKLPQHQNKMTLVCH